MTDIETLEWIYNRMVNVHNENENYDYMHRFKKVIDTYKSQIHVDRDIVEYWIELCDLNPCDLKPRFESRLKAMEDKDNG